MKRRIQRMNYFADLKAQKSATGSRVKAKTRTLSLDDSEIDSETEKVTKSKTKDATESDSETEIEDQPQPDPDPSKQVKLPLSQQETVDPTDWQQKYKSWSDVGTSLTKQWPDNMGLEPTEYRFAAKHGITLETNLGAGAQGSVWKASVKDLKTGKVSERAVKVLNLFDYSKNKQRNLERAIKAMMRETDNVFGLEHPNLVTPKAIFNIHDEETKFPYCRVLLVMELCDDDLENMIDSKRKLSERRTRNVMTQVCQGLKFLHDNRVAHLDIKPGNILYVGKGDQRRYKLSDFGLSYKFAPRETITKRVGTPEFIAPELDGKREADPRKADIYSLGMTMLNMLVGDKRFTKLAKKLSLKSTKRTTTALLAKYNISAEVCLLFQAMTTSKYKERPDIDTVIADKWFKTR